MRIAIGADHGGFDLKEVLKAHLVELGHEVHDVGTHDTRSVDYPDFAHAVAWRVKGGEAERGVLVCGTGQGMAMAAGQVPGVRAGCVSDAFSARMIAAHNDARVITLGGRVVGPDLAKTLVDAFLGASFEGGRHQRRVDKQVPAAR